MSTMEANKIVGAGLLALLSLWVIGIVGDGLVRPASHIAAEIEIAAKPPAGKAVPAAKPLDPISPLLASADVEKGKKTFKKCAACHTTAKDGKDKVGPNLWAIVNAPRARREGFAYSSALKAKEGEWSFESLNAFLAKPKAYVPKTKMAFVGLKKTRDRANVILYLRSLSDAPAALP